MQYQNRLREIREDKDLTQREVSKALNISQVAYSYYELGKRQIPNDILRKLALYYNVSIDYILYMTDIRKPYPRSIVKL